MTNNHNSYERREIYSVYSPESTKLLWTIFIFGIFISICSTILYYTRQNTWMRDEVESLETSIKILGFITQIIILLLSIIIFKSIWNSAKILKTGYIIIIIASVVRLLSKLLKSIASSDSTELIIQVIGGISALIVFIFSVRQYFTCKKFYYGEIVNFTLWYMLGPIIEVFGLFIFTYAANINYNDSISVIGVIINYICVFYPIYLGISLIDNEILDSPKDKNEYEPR